MRPFPLYRIEQISKTEIFKGFTTDEIITLLSDVNYAEIKYKAGKYIYLAEEQAESLSFLVEGAVASEILSESGKQLIVKELTPPQLIIPAMLFGEVNNPINVKAVKESVLIKVKKDDLERKLQANRKFLTNFLTLLSNRFIILSQKLTFLNFYSIREKLISYLLEQIDEKSGISEQSMSITKLADYFGVERTSLSTEFSKLEREGYIKKLSNKRVEILDITRFRGLL